MATYWVPDFPNIKGFSGLICCSILIFANGISALFPEIFKFDKCVKYANEVTDDMIHSTIILGY